MKIGYDREDALVGERYAVSAHLLEGRAAELLKKRFPDTRTVLIRNGEEPRKQGIVSMLEKNDYQVISWDGGAESLCRHLVSGQVILFTVGDMHEMVPDADLLSNIAGDAVAHVFWMSSPRGAFTLPPEGLRSPELTLADPTLFDDAGWSDALPYAVRLGVLLDKHLFSLVFSSFDPVTLLTRGCRLIGDLAREDRGNIRARLAFGVMAAQVIDRLTGHEMPEAESLALGMQYEARLASKLGVASPKKLHDLEGVLSYHGYPRAIVATGEELSRVFLDIFGGRDTLTLTLPTSVGRCRTADYRTADLARLLLALGE